MVSETKTRKFYFLSTDFHVFLENVLQDCEDQSEKRKRMYALSVVPSSFSVKCFWRQN